ncbi:MAG: hypothetical protein U0324_17760 [Polyangiales bacterium]
MNAHVVAPAGAFVASPSRVGHDRVSMAEETRIHTRLQRLALGVEESRAYWANVDPSVPPAERAVAAFEGRWFGAKSLERIRVLLPYLAARYDAFPDALAALRRWRAMEPDTRRAISHWHLQLTDPIYRAFAGDFLPARRGVADATLDRPAVLRWVRGASPGRWGESTLVQFASKLLSAGAEAGLLSPAPDPRKLPLPRVPDDALVYLLHLLREVRFEGSLADNPYLRSVGIEGTLLDHRLRGITALRLQRVGSVCDFEWTYPTLAAWAETLA